MSQRTGVAAATLRAWERRYGVPTPTRSESRYRLYSERDLLVVRRMAELLASGVRPAQAARLATAGPSASVTPAAGELTEHLVRAAVEFDEGGIRLALERAFAHRLPAQTYDEVVSPALVGVGALWQSGALSVAHEHLFASLVRARLLERLDDTLPDAASPRAVLACADDDQHDLGLIGFALHVASWGFRPIVLGVRVPPPVLAAAIRHLRPAFVALSFVSRIPPRRAKVLFAGYAAALHRQRWVVGGPGIADVAEHARRAGAFVASTAAEARGWVLA